MDTLLTETASLSLRTGLTDLPVEVQRLIARHLTTSGCLWAPWYTDKHSNYGRLTWKHAEYYGTESTGGTTLMNWSTCSRHFRALLIPEAFKTIVLRSRPRSMASVRTLQSSAIWSHVQELCFAGTWGPVRVPKDRSKWGGATNKGQYIVQKIQNEMAELTAILENLPPNLSSLSLDFPQGWDYNYMEPLSGGKSWIRIEGDTAVRYDVDRYPILVQHVLSAVSKNNISAKPVFQFKILGLVPLDFECQLEDELATFLRNVTSFTLGLCHYMGEHPWFPDDEHSANSIPIFHNFSSNVHRVYLNHLHRTTSLQILADVSWPLGLKWISGQDFSIASPLSFPTDPHVMPNLSTVSFTELIISQELIDFLVLHSNTLESVELVDCSAWASARHEDDGIDLEDDPISPSWSHLFRALVIAKPARLSQFIIDTPYHKNLIRAPGDGSEWSVEQQRIHDIMDARTEELENFTDETDRERAEWRLQRVLSYCEFDEEDGSKLHAVCHNVQHFLAGRDHRYWLQIVDIMESNLVRTSESPIEFK